MTGDDDRPPPIREDDDPIVVAATAVCDAADIYRRSGLITARVKAPRHNGYVMMTRSRFDGDYGDIVRLRRYDTSKADAAVLPMTFAPTFLAIAALTDGPKEEAGDRLADLYEEWVKKGQKKQ